MTPDTPLRDRRAKEAVEARDLAPWASRSAGSRGRRHAEAEDELRTVWERDRDRIVHSTSFRRLMYKTQVFINWEGDHYRTRLSHTLEVAQVARSVATALGLNEPLTEAIALAHDIGHPPFGHRGERALDRLMADHGGFRHNAHVLRVVDKLERRSPDYPGLNLTRETRESLLKHETSADWPEEFRPKPRRPCLEAQVVDLADSTAYNMHDLQDGLMASMFAEEQVEAEVALWRDARQAVEARHPGFLARERGRDRNLYLKRLTNDVIKICIGDLIRASHARVAEAGVATVTDVQAHDRLLIGHSPELSPRVAELSRFLFDRFYSHAHLGELTAHADKVLSALFAAYVDRPAEMAPWFRSWADQVGLEVAVCDYLAGMTDRFAEQEHARLVEP